MFEIASWGWYVVTKWLNGSTAVSWHDDFEDACRYAARLQVAGYGTGDSTITVVEVGV